MPVRIVRHVLTGLFLVSLVTPLPVHGLVAAKKAAAAGSSSKKKAGAPAHHPAAPTHKAAPSPQRLVTQRLVTQKPAAVPVRSSKAVVHTASVRARTGIAASRAAATRRTARILYSPWTEPTFGEPTVGDNEDGEDALVRKAAVDALGPFNGSVVVVDPQTGRILTVVNQKLAFKSGFTPCSTVKLVTSLAALKEGLIDRSTPVKIGRRLQMDMTEALAISNNSYFAKLGTDLGFEKVKSYAQLYGLGEKAGWEIPEENPGTILQLPAAHGGVGMMTSFGNGFHVTPLELAALVSAIANNGTLYYLQYPRTSEDIAAFQPKIKRQLDIAPLIAEIRPGMQGAVEYGTARRAGFDASDLIYGKTGTCSDYQTPTTHLGWFGAFNDSGPWGRKLAVVVLLTGGRQVNGPVASGVAGAFYRNLSKLQLQLEAQRPLSPPPPPGSPVTRWVTGLLQFAGF
jgi:penicillin-binding protein 2